MCKREIEKEAFGRSKRFPESFFNFLLVNNIISIYNGRHSKKHDKNEI